jgi:mRNA interferase HicA
LIRHLTAHGCKLLREGGNHSWRHNPEQNKRSAVPRHNEITISPQIKFAKMLGIPKAK